MKRKPQLTKRERKALSPSRPAPQPGGHHIHCIACGIHLDPSEFGTTATYLRCDHGSTFPSCTACEPKSRQLLLQHDRTGQPVQTANAWH